MKYLVKQGNGKLLLLHNIENAALFDSKVKNCIGLASYKAVGTNQWYDGFILENKSIIDTHGNDIGNHKSYMISRQYFEGRPKRKRRRK